MSPTIFIIDDEPFMLRLIEAALRKGGYRVEPFRDPAAAIKAAVGSAPELFVLDLVMPGTDGMTALRQMKHTPELAHVPVIMLTSRGHHLTQEEAKESGAARFLTKPFSPSELLNEARQLIGR